MGGRALFQAVGCALAATLAAGCVGVAPDGSRRFVLPPLPGAKGAAVKSYTPTFDNPPTDSAAPPAPVAGVVPAGGVVPPVPVPPLPTIPVPQPSPVPIPNPNPLPNPTPGVPGASPPGTAPVVPGSWLGGSQSSPFFGPHVRIAPTVAGALLNLGPGDIPADRVVELAKQVEAAGAENRALVGRLRELEALGVGREQALAEALREVESAAAEVARARGDVLTIRTDLIALRDRLDAVEKEDVETLRAVVAALERLLDGPPRAAAGKQP